MIFKVPSNPKPFCESRNSATDDLSCTRHKPPEGKSALPVELIRLYIDGMCSSDRGNLSMFLLRSSADCLMAVQAVPGYKQGLFDARSCFK